MAAEHNEFGRAPSTSRVGLSIVRNGRTTTARRLSRDTVLCANCGKQVTEGHAYCPDCGDSLSVGTGSCYSGFGPEHLPADFQLHPSGQHVRMIDERRYARVSCRNMQACIKTGMGSSLIVNLINISRGGMCFRSSVHFEPGTPVSTATHYVSGGQNIFQDGHVVRVQARPSNDSPGEYAVQFSFKNALSVGMG